MIGLSASRRRSSNVEPPGSAGRMMAHCLLAPLLAPVFRSEGQARLLAALLLGGDELSITDLAGRAGLAYPTAHREVERLLDAGVLVERHVGRTRLVRGNPESPLVAPLRDILAVATGPVVLLAKWSAS